MEEYQPQFVENTREWAGVGVGAAAQGPWLKGTQFSF